MHGFRRAQGHRHGWPARHLHTKAAGADGAWAVLSSANLTEYAFDPFSRTCAERAPDRVTVAIAPEKLVGADAGYTAALPAPAHRGATGMRAATVADSAKSRELRALGRVQIRTEDLARAQLALMNSRARGDGRGVEIAEQHVGLCEQRLVKAALALDRVLVERGDEDGRRLVEGALQLTSGRAGSMCTRTAAQ